MTDITKCRNDTCPMRENCYRFTAKDSLMQSYSMYVYENGMCVDYIPNLGEVNYSLTVEIKS